MRACMRACACLCWRVRAFQIMFVIMRVDNVCVDMCLCIFVIASLRVYVLIRAFQCLCVCLRMCVCI